MNEIFLLHFTVSFSPVDRFPAEPRRHPVDGKDHEVQYRPWTTTANRRTFRRRTAGYLRELPSLFRRRIDFLVFKRRFLTDSRRSEENLPSHVLCEKSENVDELDKSNQISTSSESSDDEDRTKTDSDSVRGNNQRGGRPIPETSSNHRISTLPISIDFETHFGGEK